VPARLSKTPGRVRGLAPDFGEHTREVLLESGFPQAEIDRLQEEGVIGLGE